MTYAKIVSFLMVSPFTFEQLWKISRIHRNTLGKRLQYLIKEGVVFKHKYSIPHTKEFYGYMYKYSVPNPYTAPLYGHTYYLLNCSRPACGGLVNFYYNNKAREKFESTEKSLQKGSRNRPNLSVFHDRIGEILKELEQDRDRVEGMNEPERNEYWHKYIESAIFMYRFIQENRIAAVKRGIRLNSSLEDISESKRNEVIKVAEFFTKKGYSLMDALIRCSTENLIIPLADILNMDIVSYNILWDIMSEEGMLRDFL